MATAGTVEEKENQNLPHKIPEDPQKTEKDQISLYRLLLMIGNAITMFFSYLNSNYVPMVVNLLIVVSLAIWIFCLPKFPYMTENENSRLKFWEKWTVLLVIAGNSFNMLYMFAPAFDLPTMLALSTFAFACCAFALYVYIIEHRNEDWKIRSAGGNGTGVVKKQRLDAALSVMEKV